MKYKEEVELFALWFNYKRFKCLPYSGGFLEQDHRFLETVNILDPILEYIQEMQRKANAG